MEVGRAWLTSQSSPFVLLLNETYFFADKQQSTWLST